jgi:hypothetical protein
MHEHISHLIKKSDIVSRSHQVPPKDYTLRTVNDSTVGLSEAFVKPFREAFCDPINVIFEHHGYRITVATCFFFRLHAEHRCHEVLATVGEFKRKLEPEHHSCVVKVVDGEGLHILNIVQHKVVVLHKTIPLVQPAVIRGRILVLLQHHVAVDGFQSKLAARNLGALLLLKIALHLVA